MALVVPKYRTYDDSVSVPDALAVSLVDLVEPEAARVWDLIPFAPALTRLDYKMASRGITPRKVTLDANFGDSDTDITFSAVTKTRVTASHVLYHPASKQRIVLDDMNQTTGVANIRSVLQAPGGSRVQIDSGQELLVIGHSEHYDKVQAESRFEETSEIENYVQDLTEVLEFSIADLREQRKWGVDKEMRIRERMNDIFKDLNLSVIYGVPQNEAANESALTAGFDYVVEQASGVVNAAQSGTLDIDDLRSVARDLAKGGLGPAAGMAAVMSPDIYYGYEDLGLDDFTSEIDPEESVYIGNTVRGISVSGIGRIPFYIDPFIEDTRVRFISTRYARKAYYQGEGDGAILESLRVVPEPSLSTSKNEKSSVQQKWGTLFMNAETAHRILDTGVTLS